MAMRKRLTISHPRSWWRDFYQAKAAEYAAKAEAQLADGHNHVACLTRRQAKRYALLAALRASNAMRS